MRSKEINKAKIDKYIGSLKRDIGSLKFEEEEIDGKKKITLRIGNFFFSKPVEENYEVSVKRLFEDFMTNTSYYYIRNFWEL